MASCTSAGLSRETALWKNPIIMGAWSVVRWVRAAGFAAACAGLAAAGHVAGGGGLRPWAVPAGFLIVFVPALLLSGRERTMASILPATATSQAVLHVLLSPAAGDQDAALVAALATADGASAQVHHSGPFNLAMVLMHAVSVLLTASWLVWGEARLCALVRLLTSWMLRPLLFLIARRPPASPRQILLRRAAERSPVRAFLRYALARRGPPEAMIASGAAS
ncbi:hypothetical protein [Spirillospora sp. NPDC047279]|uniref:hypothetical protein n=1 Tax=Spirillospora sp. NPDC047279 TaxID=3155478 RepID=UPI0033E53D94